MISLKPTFHRDVCSHLQDLVHDWRIKVTLTVAIKDLLTYMPDYLSMAEIQMAFWPEVPLKFNGNLVASLVPQRKDSPVHSSVSILYKS